MGEPRKVFRIEEIAVMRRQPLAEAVPAAPGYAEIMQELSALRAIIAPAPPSPAADIPQRAGIERLTSALNLLHAVLRGTPMSARAATTKRRRRALPTNSKP